MSTQRSGVGIPLQRLVQLRNLDHHSILNSAEATIRPAISLCSLCSFVAEKRSRERSTCRFDLAANGSEFPAVALMFGHERTQRAQSTEPRAEADIRVNRVIRG